MYVGVCGGLKPDFDKAVFEDEVREEKLYLGSLMEQERDQLGTVYEQDVARIRAGLEKALQDVCTVPFPVSPVASCRSMLHES